MVPAVSPGLAEVGIDNAGERSPVTHAEVAGIEVHFVEHLGRNDAG